MAATTPVERIEVAPVDLRRILDLYTRGLLLQAYAVAQEWGPLKAWSGTAARVMAGRLAIHLGAPRLGRWLHLHAWRDDPWDPQAQYYYAWALLERRGPLAAWDVLKRWGDWPDADPEYRADWLAMRASVAALLRDFDTAEHWLARAEETAPASPWIRVERARVLELEDRYPEALAAARGSLELRPWFRPGVSATAHVLQLLGRDDEALELLGEAAQRLESGAVLSELALLQIEVGRFADARRSLERFAELSPLLEEAGRQWLNARRSDAAYYDGDFARAAEFAREAGNPFYQQIAERLAAGGPGIPPGEAEGRRVLLPVGFVRQHYMTCAPATLSALSRFWSMPADHLEVAEAICYGGTADHSERHWAEQQGWVVREFTVTWESAVALLDRGVPFTLTTLDTGSGHLQAVIGYDSRRGTLLIRDPSQRLFREFIVAEMVRWLRSTGPRGMALVPRAQAALLDGLDLPDAALYDLYFRLQRALEEHDRPAAAEAWASMQAAAPDHRLTLRGALALAAYDGNPSERLRATEALLERYPEDNNLQLARISYLRELARRDEWLALLRDLSDRPGADPYFWQQYAQALAPDARTHDRAIRLLRRAIRYRPTTAANFYTLAHILWDQRRFERALELYRFAACLEDKNEQLARDYFIAARYLKQTETALLLLRNRFQRFGKLSGWPARTLFWACGQLGQVKEGFDVLDAALDLRPEDGDLLLAAADAFGRYGHFDRASALLVAAAGQTAHTAWLRTAAGLASAQGNQRSALALWRQVAAVEPLALEAHRAIAQLLAETHSRAAALEHLQQACATFPHNYPLHQLWIEWLRQEGPAAREPVIRRLIEIHPADAWSRRELALVLADQGRLDEAFAELDLAHHLEPVSVSYHCVRAHLCTRAGKRDEAREAYRDAIRLSVDCDLAISELVTACDSLAERRQALAFVEQELERQVVYGNGLLAYREQAQQTLEPQEVLALLRRALEARPDLWHAWSAVIHQLLDMSRSFGESEPSALLDEAHALGRQAVARFPLLPQLWLDLAQVCRAREEGEAEEEALRHALQINPGWGPAARQLAEVQERTGRPDEAKALLRQAITFAPLDPVNHGCLADLLWRTGEKETALEQLQHALRLEPGYEWAWNALRSWAGQLDRPRLAVDFARDLTVRRAGEARSWLILARMLAGPEEVTERLAALDRVLALNPLLVEAADMRAEVLAQQGRFDEALAACRAPVWGSQQPLVLRGRAAWVEAQRENLPGAIEQMRAAVAEDPNYAWGWRQLADWCRSTQDNPGYREAAGHLARLMPRNPTSWGYLGEAKLRLRDRAAAKADLRRALELAPDYGFAAMTLFDEQLADNELEDASRTLTLFQEHQAEDEFILARVVQLASARGDRDSAVATFRRLCERDFQASWPLDTARAALDQAGWSEAVDEAVPAALASSTINSRAVLAWVERWADRQDWSAAQDKERKKELEERLAALDRVGSVPPDFFPAFDLKAELLARVGRFEEALAACGPVAGQDQAPLPLHGRAAWVEHQRGKKTEAITRMRALVTESPNYSWGWSCLAEWYRSDGTNSEYLEAAQKNAELTPRSSTAWGFLGEARLRSGDRVGAKEAFRRALELAPDYLFAGLSLYDAHLADEEIDDAAATLDRLQQHLRKDSLLARQVEVTARRGDEVLARQRLGELCRALQLPDLLDRALAALDRAGWASQADQVLGEALLVPQVHPHCALVWVKRRTARQDWSCAARLEEMVTRGEVPLRALAAYARALGKAKKRQELRQWVGCHRDRLRQESWSWGQVGSAFGTARDFHEAVRWMDDWAARSDAEPWMLINHALHLRVLGRVEEADRVHHHARTLRPDYTSAFHELWLALDEALAGETAVAAAHLARIDSSQLDDYHRYLRTLAEAVLQVQQAGRNERGHAFDEARQRLREAVTAYPTLEQGDGLEATYRRCVRRLARDCGGLSAALWSCWRCLRPDLPKVKEAD